MLKTTTCARLRRAHVVVGDIEMSWETTDVLAADTADVLAADTRDVLAADTTDVLAADTTDVLAADTTDVLSADTSLQSSAMAPWSGGSFREDFDFWCQGMIFWRVLVGSWKSPASFLQGLATPMVRWEVSYEGKSFQKKFEIWSGPKIGKCPKLAREAPRAAEKIKKQIGPKRALGPNLGPWALYALGPN